MRCHKWTAMYKYVFLFFLLYLHKCKCDIRYTPLHSDACCGPWDGTGGSDAKVVIGWGLFCSTTDRLSYQICVGGCWVGWERRGWPSGCGQCQREHQTPHPGRYPAVLNGPNKQHEERQWCSTTAQQAVSPWLTVDLLVQGLDFSRLLDQLDVLGVGLPILGVASINSHT